MLRQSLIALALAMAPLASAMAQPQTVEIPQDFKIKWMRGMVLSDDPKGALIVKGNDSRDTGAVFTLINGQPVSGVSDLIA